MISLRPGMTMDRDKPCCASSVEIQYERNDLDFVRGTFRVRGDTCGDHPRRGVRARPAGGILRGRDRPHFARSRWSAAMCWLRLEHAAVFPATHYATDHSHDGGKHRL